MYIKKFCKVALLVIYQISSQGKREKRLKWLQSLGALHLQTDRPFSYIPLNPSEYPLKSIIYSKMINPLSRYENSLNTPYNPPYKVNPFPIVSPTFQNPYFIALKSRKFESFTESITTSKEKNTTRERKKTSQEIFQGGRGREKIIGEESRFLGTIQ